MLMYAEVITQNSSKAKIIFFLEWMGFEQLITLKNIKIIIGFIHLKSVD